MGARHREALLVHAVAVFVVFVVLVAGAGFDLNLRTTPEHNELLILTELSDRIGLFRVAA